MPPGFNFRPFEEVDPYAGLWRVSRVMEIYVEGAEPPAAAPKLLALLGVG